MGGLGSESVRRWGVEEVDELEDDDEEGSEWEKGDPDHACGLRRSDNEDEDDDDDDDAGSGRDGGWENGDDDQARASACAGFVVGDIVVVVKSRGWERGVNVEEEEEMCCACVEVEAVVDGMNGMPIGSLASARPGTHVLCLYLLRVCDSTGLLSTHSESNWESGADDLGDLRYDRTRERRVATFQRLEGVKESSYNGPPRSEMFSAFVSSIVEVVTESEVPSPHSLCCTTNPTGHSSEAPSKPPPQISLSLSLSYPSYTTPLCKLHHLVLCR
ncbi:hypothetical protein NMY22_g19876 [Coprinellus aureogranulatus]|nr:hypothetical protein NMY22_g19876 [Coprinellus aureogranulatus]